MILNYAVGLDVVCKTCYVSNDYLDGTQSTGNTQGVWSCKLPVDSLPLKILVKSPELMSGLNKQPRRNFQNTVAG